MTKIPSTLGFLFFSDLKKVLLFEKQKPIHHKGLLNGLGGKHEKGEDDVSCIVREVEEEAGILTHRVDWKVVGTLHWLEWEVSILTARLSEEINSKELEKYIDVSWYDVNNLPSNIITNLSWLIPMSTDTLNGNDFLTTIHYHCEEGLFRSSNQY